jgi:hypothetical protein
MKAFGRLKSIGKGAKSGFRRLRNRAGKFAFMGGKTKKAPKTAKGIVLASQGSRDAFTASKNAKARNKAALKFARNNPGKVARFAVNKFFGVGGKGRGAIMGARNAFSTVKANIPQGFKDRTKNFAAKHSLGTKASTAWDVTKTLSKDPVFVASAVVTVISGARLLQQASAYDKGQAARNKPGT